jgi:hypothetical protein
MGHYGITEHRIAELVHGLGAGPWRREQILALGWSPKQLERAVFGGGLVRLRRGLYAVPSIGLGPDAYRTELSRVRGIMASLSADAVLSHDSAARLHGMWTPGLRGPLVHVTVPGQAEREDAALRVHASRLPAQFVTTVKGLRVTTVARTAVDLARGRDLPQALVAIDGAWRTSVAAQLPDSSTRLRERTVPDAVLAPFGAELLDAFAVVWSWPGSRVVRTAIDLAEPASESAYESWSRGWMEVVGLPRPVVNAEVYGRSGRRYFGDFVWRSRRVIGEADGVGKYGETPDAMRARLRAERERQDDLEAAGWSFVRWVTGEPARVVMARVARTLYLGPPL